MADNTASVVTALLKERELEISLFEHFERVIPIRGGSSSVVFNLLKFRDHHRRLHHIWIVARSFGMLLNTRDFTKERSYRIYLDNRTQDTMRVVGHERLGSDMNKLIWKRVLPMDVSINKGRRLVRAVIAPKAIFPRCDDYAVVVFGLKIGV
ncbi:MAG: hypothetical protein VYE18_07200 [Pseudomonadota bacterium]|nr:hypothetical protein [Pseudomonadota bacterium]